MRNVLRGFAGVTTLSFASYKYNFNALNDDNLNLNDDVLSNNNVIISGTAVPDLAKLVAKESGFSIANVQVKRFKDGEISCRYEESVREKNLFIIQSCAAPVNDNIMELLLLVSAAKRAGAHRVTAIIPYFGYKYHRRGLPISSVYNSRFLWSSSSDLADMLTSMGVDAVLAVDLQRPGQGHEACFFDNDTPIETISSNDLMVQYFADHIPLGEEVVIVSPNSDCVKKAIKFKQKLSKLKNFKQLSHGLFLPGKSGNDDNVTSRVKGVEFLGNVHNADVVIVDDILETGNTLSVLTRRLVKEGARRVYLCASHGLFSSSSMELIDLSPVEQVVVTDSIRLPPNASEKIAQVSVAPLLTQVIKSEASRNLEGDDLTKYGAYAIPIKDDEELQIE